MVSYFVVSLVAIVVIHVGLRLRLKMENKDSLEFSEDLEKEKITNTNFNNPRPAPPQGSQLPQAESRIVQLQEGDVGWQGKDTKIFVQFSVPNNYVFPIAESRIVPLNAESRIIPNPETQNKCDRCTGSVAICENCQYAKS